MEEIIMIGYLSINSWMDIRKRQISLMVTFLFVLGTFLWKIYEGRELKVIIMGLIPGMALIMVSKITREALGYGDGILMIAVGLYLGLGESLSLFFTGLMLAAVWAGFLLFIRKKGREYEFPLVPFLLIGYVGRCLLRL